MGSAALRRGGEHRGGKDSVATAQRQIFINFNNFFFFLCGQYKLWFGAASITHKGRDKQSAEARNNVLDFFFFLVPSQTTKSAKTASCVEHQVQYFTCLTLTHGLHTGKKVAISLQRYELNNSIFGQVAELHVTEGFPWADHCDVCAEALHAGDVVSEAERMRQKRRIG